MDPTPWPEIPDGSIAVVIEGARFIAEVAATPAEHRRGLSGRELLAPDAGMWFDFGREMTPQFWMFDMHFPIDMVWITEDLRVVHVTHEAPVPESGTDSTKLPRYDSLGVPIRYVLEINAGLAREHGIAGGSEVRIEGP